MRWNPIEDSVRVCAVVDGAREQLDGASVQADPAAWQVLRARMAGDRITCRLDGEELLHDTDARLPGPGAIGLCAKADATTAFGDLVLRS